MNDKCIKSLNLYKAFGFIYILYHITLKYLDLGHINQCNNTGILILIVEI